MTTLESEALAAAFVIMAIVLAVVALRPPPTNQSKRPYRRWKRSPSKQYSVDTPIPSPNNSPAVPDLSDVGAQLNAIMKAAFAKRRVMNRSEYEVFRIVENEVLAARKGHRAFAQTSMGQILESPSNDAFRSINAKRVDILVVDRAGWPVFAVEYQGQGHHQGTAAARDAIKKEALRRAGVGYLEVTPGDDEEQLRLRIRQHLGAVSSPNPPKPRGRPSANPSKLVPQLH